MASDSKFFIYDGKTGDTLGEFSADEGHKGSIVSSCLLHDNASALDNASYVDGV